MKIIRLKKVITKTDLSRSTIYELIKMDLFPKQLSLGPRCVGWLEEEVDDWIIQKAEERNLKPTIH